LINNFEDSVAHFWVKAGINYNTWSELFEPTRPLRGFAYYMNLYSTKLISILSGIDHSRIKNHLSRHGNIGVVKMFKKRYLNHYLAKALVLRMKYFTNKNIDLILEEIDNYYGSSRVAVVK
jgi:hypothetical protein